MDFSLAIVAIIKWLQLQLQLQLQLRKWVDSLLH